MLLWLEAFHMKKANMSSFYTLYTLPTGKFCNFFCRQLIFFQNQLFGKNTFRNTIRVSNSSDPDQVRPYCWPGPKDIFIFPYFHAKMIMKCILLINVKMSSTIVGILTFISRINTASDDLRKLKKQIPFSLFNLQ